MNQSISFIRIIAVGLLACVVAACDKRAQGKGIEDSVADLPALLLAPEDVLPVTSRALGAGPAITGSILPEKRADLRAEVSAIVLSVLKDNGDPVKKGQLLVQLDDTSIRDSLASSQTAAEAASQAYDQAQRQYERLAKLRETGVVAAQQVEDVEVRRNAAQSDREAAKSRLVAARQQQQRTLVRAPFDGIVSDRRVSAGDTAQVGKELLKVIDPASLRFEGFVSADSIGLVHPGQDVTFHVHGFEGKEFSGKITRVNPAANSLTRQVEVLVSFASGQQQPEVAGLYAEGRIQTESKEGIAVPAGVIVREGDDAFAWKVEGGKLQRVALKLGERDPRRGEYEVLSGLSAGDEILTYPTTSLHDGQAVQRAGQ